eukprot:14540599-Alexandrium_andersonii.AAC.1
MAGKRRRVGSIDWLESSSERPAASSSLPDLYAWPDHAVVDLASRCPEAVGRLSDLAHSRVRLDTQYSGKGTAE